MDNTSMKNEVIYQESPNWSSRLIGRLSKAQVVALAQDLHHDEHGISEVYGMMLQSDDARLATNAAWVLAHLSAADRTLYLFPYYDELVDLAISPSLIIRRGLVFAILLALPDKEELRADLLDFCLNRMADGKLEDSTRSYMIKLAARLCRPYPELIDELALCLQVLPLEGLSPSIACARRKALVSIGKPLLEY